MTKFRKEIAGYITKLEQVFAVEKIFYDDIPAWPIIRAHIGRKLENAHLDHGRMAQFTNERIQKISFQLDQKLAELGLLAREQNQTENENDDVISKKPVEKARIVFFSWAERNYLQKGTRFHNQEDFLFDLLEDEFDVLKVEFDAKATARTFPRWKKVDFVQSPILNGKPSRFRIWCSLNYYPKLRKKWQGIEIIKGISSDLSNNYPKIFRGMNLLRFTHDAEYIFQQSELLERHLKQRRPRVIFSNIYYNLNALSMLFAAKRMNVPFCEVINGTVGKEHWAYTNLHLYHSLDSTIIPDVFWTWDHLSSKYIQVENQQKYTSPRIIYGGNPRFHYWKKGRKKSQLKKGRPKKILITHQYLSTPSIELLKAIENSPPSCKWIFRLHPQSEILKSLYVNFFKNFKTPVKVVSAQDENIFEQLNNTTHLITEFSTTAVEALEFDVNVILTDQAGAELYENYVSEGFMNVAFTEDDILKAILMDGKEKTKPEKEKIRPALAVSDIIALSSPPKDQIFPNSATYKASQSTRCVYSGQYTILDKVIDKFTR